MKFTLKQKKRLESAEAVVNGLRRLEAQAYQKAANDVRSAVMAYFEHSGLSDEQKETVVRTLLNNSSTFAVLCEAHCTVGTLD
jgi:hypothetical protein